MIKEIRTSKGWTQEQLAQFSGLSIRTIQRIERGHNAGLESLKCLAAVFDMDLSELQNESCTGSELFLGADPILPVKSVNETAKFYKEALGFEIEILWNTPPYAVVARDRTIIEFGEGRKEYAGTGVCVIFVNDVDAVYKEYSDKDVEFFGDIANRDYGSRDFRIKDNNGNVLIFSSPLINQKELIDAGNSVKRKAVS
ncbi:MAG: helix-turn-helix domain-containing protein [Candidatus Thiodiazotropha sp. (ex Monitilora ramsayi)]|nr:helix-turn-helix domain-containing protein [Candidatus Thiodiazotropha sp. (ex Monitilora ramsayi)]